MVSIRNGKPFCNFLYFCKNISEKVSSVLLIRRENNKIVFYSEVLNNFLGVFVFWLKTNLISCPLKYGCQKITAY